MPTGKVFIVFSKRRLVSGWRGDGVQSRSTREHDIGKIISILPYFPHHQQPDICQVPSIHKGLSSRKIVDRRDKYKKIDKDDKWVEMKKDEDRK